MPPCSCCSSVARLVHRSRRPRSPRCSPTPRLDALDPTTDGSAAIADGKGLSAKPDDVVSAFAASVKYPDPTATKVLADDPLGAACASRPAPSRRPSTTRAPSPRSTSPRASSVGCASRTATAPSSSPTSCATTPSPCAHPSRLTPAKDLTLLTGIKQITTEANLTSNEIVAIVIPASGQARIVAASDQARRRLGSVRQD